MCCQVESERRLRRLAEDQALLTAEARATEEARAAARAAAEQEALRMKAKADLAWWVLRGIPESSLWGLWLCRAAMARNWQEGTSGPSVLGLTNNSICLLCRMAMQVRG